MYKKENLSRKEKKHVSGGGGRIFLIIYISLTNYKKALWSQVKCLFMI